MNYKPIDVTGQKSEETLRLSKTGLFDIVSLRAAQAARDEPFLLGQDIVGLVPDYKMARKVYDLYSPHFDKVIQEKFNSRLLGLWPFGPQVLFCKKEIKGLRDIKGMKVRVYDQSLAQFIESLGAIPVSVGFSETQQALARGVVECAITGPSSANTAGWPEVSEYFMPIGFQVGFNGYIMNLNSWKKLDAEQPEEAPDRHRRPEQGHLGLFRGDLPRRGALQCREGTLQDRQQIQDEGSSGHGSRPEIALGCGGQDLFPGVVRRVRAQHARLRGQVEGDPRPAHRHQVGSDSATARAPGHNPASWRWRPGFARGAPCQS